MNKNRELPELLKYLLKQTVWWKFRGKYGFCQLICDLYYEDKICDNEYMILSRWKIEIEMDF